MFKLIAVPISNESSVNL